MMLLGMLFLAGCSAATPAVTPTLAPTQDLNPLRTEVAATVFAQIALTPSATLPPTSTPVTPTATASPTAGTPTATTGTPGTLSNDQAKWISQSVEDGTRFSPGETFTMTWTIQNVGKTTWTAGYRLRFYSGDNFGAAKEIALGKDVKPGENVDITTQMKAPATTGKYRSDWVMSNELRANFNQPIFLQITVGLPSTATSTPSPVPATPTVTPTK